MPTDHLARIEELLHTKVDQGRYAGGQVLVAHHGRIRLNCWAGSARHPRLIAQPAGPPEAGPEDAVGPHTRYNLESITKVVVTLPLAFVLMERGLIHLDDPLVRFVPEFGTSPAKGAVTLRHLLTFTAGIPGEDPRGAAAAVAAGDLAGAWQCHYDQELASPPGTRVLYSDPACRLLGRALERAAGLDLDQAAQAWLFEPLGLRETGFRPTDPAVCAATGLSAAGVPLRGRLTQDLEQGLGGVLGSDGLFATAGDLFIFAQMLLDGGTSGGERVLSPITVEQLLRGGNPGMAQTPASYLDYLLYGPKNWLWERASAPFSYFGDLCSPEAVGKLGGAGTFLLIDPRHQLILVYLTNYGQPEPGGSGCWARFHRDLDNMALCNLALAALAGG